MSRSVWVGVLLTVLLAQAAPGASCFAGSATSMPCCEPGAHCATDGLNTPSCCGVNGPTDHRTDADRHRGTPPTSPDRAISLHPRAIETPDADAVPAACHVAGSPPRDTGPPIYLRLATLLI